MSTIINVFPFIEVALELEPEELSVHLLNCTSPGLTDTPKG